MAGVPWRNGGVVEEGSGSGAEQSSCVEAGRGAMGRRRRGGGEAAGAALVVDEGDGEVRWRGTKGGEEEVVRGGLEVEAARGSGTGTRGSSPLAALEGSRGESERRWGLGLDRHLPGLGS